MKYSISYILFLVIVTLFIACQSPGKESTGSEYMPDMAHSVAYEANYYNYYYNNTWGSEDEYYALVQPRLPVPGTISRGMSSTTYPYGNSEEERTRAINELIANPYPITDAGLAEGKELYNVFCGICHGEKGDGAGYLVRDDGGVYPVQPANFLLDEHANASNGRYYHAIMYGKNLMGSYKDKLNEKERWQVIHYIRSLQASDKKLVYNQKENTYNLPFGTPAGEKAETQMMAQMPSDHHNTGHEHNGETMHEEHEENGAGHHGEQQMDTQHEGKQHSGGH